MLKALAGGFLASLLNLPLLYNSATKNKQTEKIKFELVEIRVSHLAAQTRSNQVHQVPRFLPLGHWPKALANPRMVPWIRSSFFLALLVPKEMEPDRSLGFERCQYYFFLTSPLEDPRIWGLSNCWD